MPDINIKENQVNDAVKVLETISEFGQRYGRKLIEKELKGNKSLIIVAYVDNKPAGCIISFDRFRDTSLYCWLVGVNPDFRGLGLMSLMMKYQDNWARSNGFKILRIKTANDRREMLGYLMKDGFDISAVFPNRTGHKNLLKKILARIISVLVKLSGEEQYKVKENRITLQKTL